VSASGTAPLSYQWSKNGSAISGATSATYAMTSVVAGDAGSYTVTVSNSAGSTTSTAATLTVSTFAVAPTVTTQPANATSASGTPATFSVVAGGTAPLSYQWSKNGSVIPGATAASYAISSVQAADAGSYAVTITNAIGSATSNTATLTVNTSATTPAITTQPSNATLTVGNAATFTVVATGTAPLSYQWSKNSVAITGATSATYAIASAQSGDGGSYTVAVTNLAGSVTSNAATLTVSTVPVAPSIATQPTSASVAAGDGV
jgi:hypothetical protein